VIHPWLFALGALLLAACEGGPFGRACTEIGCVDGVDLTLLAPGNTWPPGRYHFQIGFAGTRHDCLATLPEDLPQSPNELKALRCEPVLEGSFRAKVTCREQRTADAVSESCTPVAGQWLLHVSAQGIPESLQLRIERDDRVLLERTQKLDYEQSRPNGPGCEPLCRQSDVVVTLPP